MSGTNAPDSKQLFSDEQLAYVLPASFVAVYGYIILSAYYPSLMPGVLVLLGIFLYTFFMRS
ncbi:hypothetical protein ACFQE1_01880 [Halobium palmae]|uniref:Uncharacterized protein n=1 Tax=Halobium palmae TaxID=1776492 RepID=A0ABD5RUR2_9EURY